MNEKTGPVFFQKETVKTAQNLLGKYLISINKGKKTGGMIVETEAYRGLDDPGSHAFRRRTPRNEVMFGPPGHAYVYFCYGAHFLFNIVTENEGEAGAVLIRALEPVYGIDIMMKRRSTDDMFCLTNGPAKLTQALGITLRQNRISLLKNNIFLTGGRKEKLSVSCGPRIGIKQGLNLNWRFWIKDSRFVSV